MHTTAKLLGTAALVAAGALAYANNTAHAQPSTTMIERLREAELCQARRPSAMTLAMLTLAVSSKLDPDLFRLLLDASNPDIRHSQSLILTSNIASAVSSVTLPTVGVAAFERSKQAAARQIEPLNAIAESHALSTSAMTQIDPRLMPLMALGTGLEVGKKLNAVIEAVIVETVTGCVFS